MNHYCVKDVIPHQATIEYHYVASSVKRVLSHWRTRGKSVDNLVIERVGKYVGSLNATTGNLYSFAYKNNQITVSIAAE